MINKLNSASYSGEAFPFLVELARDAKVRQALYTAAAERDEGRKDRDLRRAGAERRPSQRAGIAEAEQRPRYRSRQGSLESRADAAGEVGWGRPGDLPAEA